VKLELLLAVITPAAVMMLILTIIYAGFGIV